MQQRANFDMSNVKGYKSSTFGNMDYITNNEINYNSSNINKYDDIEEVDYSDDSFNGLTTDDILQEKIRWKKTQIERESVERIQNDEIEYVQQTINLLTTSIAEIDQELLEFENLKNISSVDPSLKNLFPVCLFDSDYLDGLTDDEFDIILSILSRYGLEDINIDIDQFKENVKSGKYTKMMLETTGSSMESLWCDNIERYLGGSSNRRKDIGLYDPNDRHTGVTEDRLLGLIYDSLPRRLYEEDRALAYYMSYLSGSSLDDQYELDNLISGLEEAIANDTYEQFRDKITLAGKKEVFRNNGYDYDSIKNSLEDAMLKYFNGTIDGKTYRILFARIMTGDNSITASTINRYPGANSIVLPDIASLENDFYLMIVEQYNDRVEQLKSEKAELNRMLTQYKNYNLECELLSLIYSSDFSKYSKLDGVSINSEYREVMTEEELNNYAYLYNKYGSDKAKEYINAKKEELNSRIGLMNASEFISKLDMPKDEDGNVKSFGDLTAEEWAKLGLDSVLPFNDFQKVFVKGFTDGIDSFFEGLINVVAADGIKSADDYERMYLSMMLSSNWLLSGTYDISSSVGNMAVPMLISTLTSLATANPTVGAAVGSALMGLSSGGNAVEGMLQEGWGFQEAYTYGILTGLSETTLGFFLGGIPGLSKIDDIPGVKGYLLNMFKEGFEESTQSIIGPYLKYIATGVEQEINWGEVAKSGIYGMITSGLISGGKMLIQGSYVSVDSIDSKSVELIAEAQNAGIELEITEEILTDPIKAEEVVNKAVENSTGAVLSIDDNILNQIELEKQKLNNPDLSDWDIDRINARIDELQNIDQYSSRIAEKLSNLTGVLISSEQIKQILSETKGERPSVAEIFGVEYEQNFLNQYFADGIIKCTSGQPPGLGGFFSSKSQIDSLIKSALSDGKNVQSVLEEALDVKPGDFNNLSFSFPVDENGNIITDINKITDVNGNKISIPSGNERNAYSGLWEPGGFTKSGMPEVSIGTIENFKSFTLNEYIEMIIGG